MDKLTPEISERCQNSVLKIVALYSNGKYKDHGSAVVIKSKGVVITNYHNILGSSNFELYQGDKKIEYERVVALSKKADLLILKLKEVKGFPNIATSNSTTVGQTVYVVGNPLEYENSITKGEINGKNRIFESSEHPMGIRMENLLQISAPLSRGNSGGGLFNSEGELIGIPSCTDERGQNLNFAIPIVDVFKLIKQASNKAISQNKRLEKEIIKFHLTVIAGDFEQALSHINNCLKINKRVNYFLYNKIELLFSLNRVSEVIKVCKKAIKNNTDDETIYDYLNSAFTIAEDRIGALKVALLSFKKYPKDYITCYIVGYRYLFVSQYNKALLYFNKAKKINPKGVDHLTGLSKMYIMLERYQEACEILTKIKKHNPKDYYTLFLLSELNYKSKNFDKALEYIDEYLRKEKYPSPDHFDIDIKKEYLYPSRYEEYMGVVARIEMITSLKHYEAALKDVNELLRKYPKESYLYVCRARILLMKDETEKALENIFLAIKINPNNINAYWFLSEIYLKMNNLQEALSAIEKPLKIAPNSIQYLIIKATALFGMKRYADVVRVCRKILKFNDRHFEALDLMRKCYLERGNLKMALVYANKQLAVKPFDSMNLYNVSNILFKSGKPKEALPYLNKALECNPHIDVHILRGKINSLLGDNRSAIEDFKKADKIEKDNVDVYHYRGMAYFKTQKYSLALIDLERATHLDPFLETELGPIIAEARKLNGIINYQS